MRGVELVMSDPGSHDVPIARIFTHAMFLDLRHELADQVPLPRETPESTPASARAIPAAAALQLTHPRPRLARASRRWQMPAGS